MDGRQRPRSGRTFRAVGLTIALLAMTVLGSEAADNVFLAASAAHARAAAAAAARAASRAEAGAVKASEIGHARAAAGAMARRAAGVTAAGIAATVKLPSIGGGALSETHATTREQQPIEDPDGVGDGDLRFHHHRHRHPYGRV